MSRVAVLGAGAGGAAAAVDLTQQGHHVSLWSRSRSTIAPLTGGISFRGALGHGRTPPRSCTTDLGAALQGAEVAVVCLPAVAHEGLARSLAQTGWARPIVLDPGGTGGALVFRKAFLESGSPPPPIAELSTLTYIARKTAPDEVCVFAVAKAIHAAGLLGAQPALDIAERMFRGVQRDRNVLSTSLRNINLVLHPPPAILAAAWVEATGGDFYVYADAVTPGVYRVIESLDDERRAVGSALGLDLPRLVEEMDAVGSVDPHAFDAGRYRDAIAGGRANSTIKAPSSLDHRYYGEDLGYAVVPFTEIARICGVATPVADSIVTIGSALLGRDLRAEGLTADRLGIAGLDAGGLLELVGDEGR